MKTILLCAGLALLASCVMPTPATTTQQATLSKPLTLEEIHRQRAALDLIDARGRLANDSARRAREMFMPAYSAKLKRASQAPSYFVPYPRFEPLPALPGSTMAPLW